MQREHTPMLQALRVRANQALGIICEENVPHPRVEDYASHLHFFTDVVIRLEDRAVRAHELVEERSRGLLGRTFSRVFSHLQNLDPHFDFDTAIALVPRAIRDNLSHSIDNHMGALVRAFATEDDAVVVAVDEDGTVDDGDDDAGDSASSA